MRQRGVSKILNWEHNRNCNLIETWTRKVSKHLSIALGFVLLAVLFLGLGEQFGVFVAEKTGVGTPADFLIVSIILLVGFLVAAGLSDTLKSKLDESEEELENKTTSVEKLKETVHDKHQLVDEVHGQARYSLQLIEKLIGKVQYEFNDHLVSRINPITEVHNLFNQAKEYGRLNLQAYLSNLLTAHLKRLSIDENITISIDIIGYFGLLLTELLDVVPTINEVTITRVNNIEVKLSHIDHIDISDHMLLSICLQQLKSEYELTEGILLIQFSDNK